jgi:hypothetical protein
MSAEDIIRGVLSRDVLREHSDEEIAVFVAAFDSLVAALREIAEIETDAQPHQSPGYYHGLSECAEIARAALAASPGRVDG